MTEIAMWVYGIAVVAWLIWALGLLWGGSALKGIDAAHGPKQESK